MATLETSDDDLLSVRQIHAEKQCSRHLVLVACGLAGVRLRRAGRCYVILRRDLPSIEPYLSKSESATAATA